MCVIIKPKDCLCTKNKVFACYRILLALSVWMDASTKLDTMLYRWLILCLERLQFFESKGIFVPELSGKRILQNREPTQLEISRLVFIESVLES